jgi:hypothetical protein
VRIFSRTAGSVTPASVSATTVAVLGHVLTWWGKSVPNASASAPMTSAESTAVRSRMNVPTRFGPKYELGGRSLRICAALVVSVRLRCHQ